MRKAVGGTSSNPNPNPHPTLTLTLPLTRWELFPDAPLYRAAAADIAAAQAAATEGDSAPQGGAPAAAAALWRDAYVKREAELERDYPCFSMPGNLRLTEPIGP